MQEDLHNYDPKNLLDKIQIKINVYKFDEDNLMLIYTNNKKDCINNSINISKEDYLKKYEDVEQVKKFFSDFIQCKFIYDNSLITLEMCEKNLIHEISYPSFQKENTEIEYILSTASSRIRYPLTNIAGLVPIIYNYNKNDKLYQQYVELIQNSSGDIISVANDLIDILNYKKNKVIIKKEEIDISKLITSCIEISKKKNVDNKLILTFNINSKVPKIFYSDKDKIKQILLNLLSNSLKFTKMGSVIISVYVDNCITLENENKKYVLIFKIVDTGTGINPDKQRIIKTLLKNNIEQNTKLAGFGLYISNYTCKMLGGKLWFNSIVDIGTVFYFSIECESYL